MTDVTTGPLAPYYELGHAAGQCGEPRDACPYRRPDRVNAWVRGWHAGEDARLQLEAFRAERRGMPHVPAGRLGA